MRARFARASAFAAVVMIAACWAPWSSALGQSEQPVCGTKLVITNSPGSNTVEFQSNDGTLQLGLPDGAESPLPTAQGGGGATLTIAGKWQSTVIALPAAGWSLRAKTAGFAYRFRDGSGTRCRVRSRSSMGVRLVCTGPAVTYRLQQPETAVQVAFAMGAAPRTFCAAFDRTAIERDGSDGRRFFAARASAPNSCQFEGSLSCGPPGSSDGCPSGEYPVRTLNAYGTPDGCVCRSGSLCASGGICVFNADCSAGQPCPMGFSCQELSTAPESICTRVGCNPDCSCPASAPGSTCFHQ